ncbi:hypothetical protein RIF29_18631 [Crotalaria pallida]|uniref:Uncharacterized protein n=1 Tax=Crotalaria pallida TaxID=3830 RepID=A0AAN9F177_CROPI
MLDIRRPRYPGLDSRDRFSHSNEMLGTWRPRCLGIDARSVWPLDARLLHKRVSFSIELMRLRKKDGDRFRKGCHALILKDRLQFSGWRVFAV